MKIQHIKFVPIIKDKIWGGQRLHTLLCKDFGQLQNGGESWELSSVEGNISVIANGMLSGMTITDAINKYKGSLVGDDIYMRYGAKFPLLIKFVDANDDLSIQVHPNNQMALERHNCLGKTEMWYVVEAEPGAKLISGFKKQIEADQYKPLLDIKQFIDTLAYHEIHHGDVCFIPAGRIHALGKGVLVAEIQQTSDITYRVYDYDRRDSNGNTRQLHVDEAKAAIDFSDVESGIKSCLAKDNEITKVADCEYFSAVILGVDGTFSCDYSQEKNCIIVMCVKGNVLVDDVNLNFGETLLIAASTDNVQFKGNGELLIVFVK